MGSQTGSTARYPGVRMPPAAAEPTRFGKYQLLERIATGGMAEIYKAKLDGIGGFSRTFAIKRILPHLGKTQDFVDMMVDEAKVAGLLSHANIVQILDLGSVDSQFYIAMEFVNGRDLGQVLGRCAEKGITLPVPHAVYVLIEMLKGLEYAHNRQVMRGGKQVPLNIVHRDVAPGNVLVSFSGEVKLTDFGIAKASVRALETRSGVIKGRFDYMSPEQAAGAPLDQRSDVFSAGVLFYEVLTGRHPFRRDGELATIDAVRRGEFVPPSEVNPDVPYALDIVVEQALRADPNERLQTATQFKEGLDRFFHDAGFIFSASTLAAFVRGLFPESAGPDRKALVGDLPTRPLDPHEMELELDEASQVANRPYGGSPANLLSGTQPSQAAAIQAMVNLADGEDSTVIRPTGVPPEANPFGDAHTLINVDPRAAAAMDTARLPLEPAPDVSTHIQPRTRAPEPVPPRAKPAARRKPARVPIEVHTAWMLVAFAGAVAAFVLGLLIGSRIPLVTGSRPTPSPTTSENPR